MSADNLAIHSRSCGMVAWTDTLTSRPFLFKGRHAHISDNQKRMAETVGGLVKEKLAAWFDTVVLTPPEPPPVDNMMRNEIISFLLRLGAATALSYFTIKMMMKYIDPTSDDKEKAEKLARRTLAAIGVANADKLQLSKHELMIATNLVDHDDAGVSWENVGGADDLRQEMVERIIVPLQMCQSSTSSALLMPPKGVLLYGPPGCGKTLIARALARAAGARFINLQLSILLDKWYGESQKLTSAIFSLAEKMQPCIIFIDEIDVLLRSRNSSDHEATAMIKSQFMSLWDGFISSARTRVIIMGATNRPQDIDAAILRRMPARFHVPMPDSHQRAAILRAILVDELYDAPALDAIAADTCAGMSGSDLREVCRMAALAAHRRENDDDTTITPTISDDDLRAGVRKVIGARVQPSYTRMKMVGEALD